MDYLIYLPFIAALTLLIYLYNRDKTVLSFSGWLVIIYTASYASAIILDFIFIKGEYTLDSTAYFIFGHFLFIVPLLKIRGNQRILVIGNDKLLHKLANVFSWLGIAAILYYIPSILEALSGNLFINRQSTYERAFVPSVGFFQAFMAIIANAFMINLFLYFYSLEKKWSKRYSVLLLISSFSFIALSLAWVGRDGFVLWGMTFVSFYLLFKWNFSREIRKKIRRPLLFVALPALILFLGITFSRFSEIAFYKANPGMAVLDYFGQQHRNFSIIYNVTGIEQNVTMFNGTIAGIAKIGLVQNTIIKNNYISRDNEAYMQKYYKTSLNIFGTFLSTFIQNFGKFGTMIIGLFWFLILINFRSFNKFSTLLLYAFCYQIILHGVFYYRLGLGFGDLNLYLMLLIYLVLKINRT